MTSLICICHHLYAYDVTYTPMTSPYPPFPFPALPCFSSKLPIYSLQAPCLLPRAAEGSEKPRPSPPAPGHPSRPYSQHRSTTAPSSSLPVTSLASLPVSADVTLPRFPIEFSDLPGALLRGDAHPEVRAHYYGNPTMSQLARDRREMVCY